MRSTTGQMLCCQSCTNYLLDFLYKVVNLRLQTHQILYCRPALRYFLRIPPTSIFCPFIICLQWKLDLHGLHISEALAALEQRLAQLSAALSLKPGTTNPWQDSRGCYNTSNTPHSKESDIGDISTTARGQQHQQYMGLQGTTQSKKQQRLSVIVGRGLHSSEGEGSLPRRVETWLLDHGFRYKSGVGSIEVSVW
jgi:hypothetical protein